MAQYRHWQGASCQGHKEAGQLSCRTSEPQMSIRALNARGLGHKLACLKHIIFTSPTHFPPSHPPTRPYTSIHHSSIHMSCCTHMHIHMHTPNQFMPMLSHTHVHSHCMHTHPHTLTRNHRDTHMHPFTHSHTLSSMPPSPPPPPPPHTAAGLHTYWQVVPDLSTGLLHVCSLVIPTGELGRLPSARELVDSGIQSFPSSEDTPMSGDHTIPDKFQGAEQESVTGRQRINVGAGLPALPKKLVEQIRANEYIDFADLPPQPKGRTGLCHSPWRAMLSWFRRLTWLSPGESFPT